MTIKLILNLFLFLHCLSVQPQTQQILDKSRLDSLKSKVEEQSEILKLLNTEIPHVLLKNMNAGKCNIILYVPIGLKIEIKSIRPNFNNKTFLCVPAAYTTTNDSIQGRFIENGKVIKPFTNKQLNGICIIYPAGPQIIPTESLNQKIIDQTKINKSSLFQQILLINNSKLVDCSIYGNKENLRRALIQFDNGFCIGESDKRISMGVFQESLKNIGAVNALYLDMGSYSEGWYINSNSQKIVIGEIMTNTNKQTNWLIYEQE